MTQTHGTQRNDYLRALGAVFAEMMAIGTQSQMDRALVAEYSFVYDSAARAIRVSRSNRNEETLTQFE